MNNAPGDSPLDTTVYTDITVTIWYWNADHCPINNAKKWNSEWQGRGAKSRLHIDWSVCEPVAQSGFIIHRTKQTINSAAMYEGWRDATSCEWWGAKNQRAHSFLALMAITSADSSSKTRLIIRTDPWPQDWLNLKPSQISHKYLPHIKQLCVPRYCTLIFDGCHQIIVSSGAWLKKKKNPLMRCLYQLC